MQRTLTALLSLSALALSAPMPDASPDAIKVPLPKRRVLTRATGEADVDNFMLHLNHTLKKYKVGSLKTYPTTGTSDLLSGLLRRQR